MQLCSLVPIVRVRVTNSILIVGLCELLKCWAVNCISRLSCAFQLTDIVDASHILYY